MEIDVSEDYFEEKERDELKVIIKWLKSQLIKKTAVIAQMKRQYRELKQKSNSEIQSYSERLRKREADYFECLGKLRKLEWHGWKNYDFEYPSVGEIVLVSRGRDDGVSVAPGYYDGEHFRVLLDVESGFVTNGAVYAWRSLPLPKEIKKR